MGEFLDLNDKMGTNEAIDFIIWNFTQNRDMSNVDGVENEELHKTTNDLDADNKIKRQDIIKNFGEYLILNEDPMAYLINQAKKGNCSPLEGAISRFLNSYCPKDQKRGAGTNTGMDSTDIVAAFKKWSDRISRKDEHFCLICRKPVILDHDTFLNHVRSVHKMTPIEYYKTHVAADKETGENCITDIVEKCASTLTKWIMELTNGEVTLDLGKSFPELIQGFSGDAPHNVADIDMNDDSADQPEKVTSRPVDIFAGTWYKKEKALYELKEPLEYKSKLDKEKRAGPSKEEIERRRELLMDLNEFMASNEKSLTALIDEAEKGQIIHLESAIYAFLKTKSSKQKHINVALPSTLKSHYSKLRKAIEQVTGGTVNLKQALDWDSLSCDKSVESYVALLSDNTTLNFNLNGEEQIAEELHFPTKCPHCTSSDTIYASDSSYKIHCLQSHPYKCSLCQKMERSTSYFLHAQWGHFKSKHPLNRPHVCRCCGIFFGSSHRLENHKCQNSLVQEASLSLRTMDDDGKPWVPKQCSHCKLSEETYKTYLEYKAHCLETHPYQCPICLRWFREQAHIRTHIRSMHNGLMTYICDQCPFITFDSEAMKDHSCDLSLVNRTKPNSQSITQTSCDVSDRILRVKNSTDFSAIHRGKSRQWKCKICNMQYNIHDTFNRERHLSNDHNLTLAEYEHMTTKDDKNDDTIQDDISIFLLRIL